MNWSWATDGITDETPRTAGPECFNYMTNRRRWIEAVLLNLLFIYILRWAMKRLDPIILPPPNEINKPHTAIRLMLLLAMTFTFGIEMGFKFAGKSVINVMNPCHIQTLVQIYLLAAKPSKTTIALFRIQMNYMNGPMLAFLFPEVECRTFTLEQATYWMQHALLYIIPVYILRSGAYQAEDIYDYNWLTIGITIMLIYHFVVLNALSIYFGVNLNHMLCPALADPFQGQNYRIAAVIHESMLCPILNKLTVLIFSKNLSKLHKAPLEKRRIIDRNDDLIQHDHDEIQSRLMDDRASSSLYEYHQKQLLPTEMSLAAEMAAATGEPMGTILTQRRLKGAVSVNAANSTFRSIEAAMREEVEMLIEQEMDNSSSESVITADYSMPTTKID